MANQPDRDSTIIWLKSHASGGNSECVEVALVNSSVLVRDSRGHSGVILTFSPAQWSRFVRGIKTGKLIPAELQRHP